jgi:hypothetical protein
LSIARIGKWGNSIMGIKRGLAVAAVLSVGLGGCVAAPLPPDAPGPPVIEF